MQNEGRREPICGHLLILFAWTRLVVDGPDTQCAKDCGPRKCTGNCTRMTVFTPAPAGQAVFIFILFLRVRNQANQLNMQIKLSYQYF